ncbi:DUF4259 domain-containing protein [Lysobacter sp. GCM10012299]|uniref:DUF4259 domain-containing protein n=1 Tax=Lysobacter sp. GCM10012299 TaxID=3317333 RepID=UPI003614B1B9
MWVAGPTLHSSRHIAAKPSQELLSRAREALTRIMGQDSEPKELWEESEFETWESSIKALESAITA